MSKRPECAETAFADDKLGPGVRPIAEYLNESERRTRYLIDTGQIPAQRVGNRYYSFKSQLRRAYGAPES
jgi:hypothetical protein